MRHFFCRWVHRPPEVDLNGYPRISGYPYCRNIQILEMSVDPTTKKVTQSKSCRLKMVNYFTCMQHFSCRWYGPPEVDLNGYPRISNPDCRDIQIRKCEWTQHKKMTQSKSPDTCDFTCMRSLLLLPCGTDSHFQKLIIPANGLEILGYPRISNPTSWGPYHLQEKCCIHVK